MSEIKKLYENCNIKPKQEGYCDWDSNCPYPRLKCNDECPYWKDEDEAKYPPFTAEKQIELIKWLGKLDGKLEITCTYNKEKFIFYFYFNRKTDKNPDPKYPYSNFLNADIEILIASIINDIWQDLTEEEKASIKNILEM